MTRPDDPRIGPEFSDPELRSKISLLLRFADVECDLRAAMMTKVRKQRDKLMRRAKEHLAGLLRDRPGDAELAQARGELGQAMRGLGRRGALSDALEILVAKRRAARVEVDARGAAVGTPVPPLSVFTDPAAAAIAQAKMDRVAAEHPSLDAFDASLRRGQN